MISHKTLSVVAIAAFAFVGCDRDREWKQSTMSEEKPIGEKASDILKKADEPKTEEPKTEMPTAKGGGQPAEGSREWARDRMARVRCDHYQTCGDIAKGKKYDSFESCVLRERASIDKDWKIDDCAKIDTPRLDACIAKVNAKKCDVLFTTFPTECSSSKVCIEK